MSIEIIAGGSYTVKIGGLSSVATAIRPVVDGWLFYNHRSGREVVVKNLQKVLKVWNGPISVRKEKIKRKRTPCLVCLRKIAKGGRVLVHDGWVCQTCLEKYKEIRGGLFVLKKENEPWTSEGLVECPPQMIDRIERK